MSRRPAFVLLWLVTDSIVFVASYSLAYFLRVGWIFSSDFPFSQFLAAAILTVPAWLVVLVSSRTFALLRKQSDPRTMAYVAYACLVGMAVFTLVYYFLFEQFFSRLLLLTALILNTVATWAWHLAYAGFLRTMLRRGTPAYPTLIIGATREAAALIQNLQQHHSPLTPVAVLDGRGTKETELSGVPVKGRLHKLEETLEQMKITHLIQCSDLEQSVNLLSACRNRGITYLLLPSVLGIVERDERVETLEGRPVTAVRPPEPLWKWFFS